jgi:PAS domain S-box-containing protein
VGVGLLVSFTDTAEQPRTPVEQALRASQAAERAARAEAEEQRAQLHRVFEQAPVAIALLEGPTYRIQLANPAVCEIWARTPAQLLSLPLLEALPELRGQGVDALLDGVLHSGQPYVGTELPIELVRHGRRETIFFNFVYQPQRDAQGQTTGVLVVATDVTEVVIARQRVEVQERRTAELNAELAAANEEIRANNEALSRSQHALQRLNRELEARVEERTLALQLEVAKRGQAQQQAEHSEARFRRLAETTPLIVWEADAAGSTTYLSPNWEQFTSAANGQGFGWQEYMHPEDQAPFLQAWLTAVSTGQPFQAEMRLRVAATGEYRWHLDRAVPLRDAAGQVRQWVGAAIDVHELKRLQQSLLESEQYFRAMADHLPAMVWVTDAQGQCTYLNEQWYAFTGHTPTQALGEGWLNAVHPEDAPQTRQAFREANAQQGPFRVLYRLRRHNGQYRWAIDAARPRFAASGEFEGMAGVVIDVHEQQLAEQALRRLTYKLRTARDEAQSLNADLHAANEQLTRTNVDLDNFIYSASHDLKAPISNIEGLLYLLHEELPLDISQGPYVGPTLGLMRESVERFKRTIHHLTEVSKLQKEHAPATTAVDLATIVEDVRQDLTQLIQATGARVRIEVRDFPPVLFPEKNLRSVVYNLLSNALKYHSPHRTPHIDVQAHVRTNFTVLEVHDNGLGLDAAHLPKLFTMFQRFHDHVEGTGVGLYMVKKMVENAGGRVEVHSYAGAGTSFFVHLPHVSMPSS